MPRGCRSALVLLLALVAGAVVAGCNAGERPATARSAQPAVSEHEPPETMLAAPIRWRRSQPRGLPHAGRLVRGVQLPAEGEDFFTWDPIRNTVPNRGARRHATDRLLRVLLRVLGEYRAAHPD